VLENDRVGGGLDGFLAPWAPLGDGGRGGVLCGGAFESGKMASVADYAAMRAAGVVVGVGGDSRSGLEAGEPRQQDENQNATE
jgi:hypothetical protein